MPYSTIIACRKCKQQNRVPVGRLTQHPACGACQTTLPAPTEPLEVGDADLPALLRESTLPVVVDFWAPWCGPCRLIGPPLAALASEFSGRVLVAKVNVDDNPASARAYDARSIPLLIGFSGGAPVAQQVGAPPPAQLRAWVEGVVTGAPARPG